MSAENLPNASPEPKRMEPFKFKMEKDNRYFEEEKYEHIKVRGQDEDKSSVDYQSVENYFAYEKSFMMK